MSAELEAKVLSAVLKDKQIHILLQANPDNLFKTHYKKLSTAKFFCSNNKLSSRKI